MKLYLTDMDEIEIIEDFEHDWTPIIIESHGNGLTIKIDEAQSDRVKIKYFNYNK